MGIQPVRRSAATVQAPPRVFVTDYDGTLLTDQRSLRSRDLATLARLQQEGVVTIIATGRSLFSFERSLASLGMKGKDLPVDYLVFSTGAGVMDLNTGCIIRSLDLEAPQITEACAFFDAREMDYMIHRPVPDTPYFVYKTHGHPNPDFQARISLYPGFGQPLDKGQAPCARATEVLAIVPREALSLSHQEVQAALGGGSVIFATSPLDGRSVWIEVFHREVSKSLAVAWLADRLGTAPDQVAAVGNDYNDLDLLQWAGTAWLVENAPPDLAGGRVPSNNDCGVSHAAEAAGLLGKG